MRRLVPSLSCGLALGDRLGQMVLVTRPFLACRLELKFKTTPLGSSRGDGEASLTFPPGKLFKGLRGGIALGQCCRQFCPAYAELTSQLISATSRLRSLAGRIDNGGIVTGQICSRYHCTNVLVESEHGKRVIVEIEPNTVSLQLADCRQIAPAGQTAQDIDQPSPARRIEAAHQGELRMQLHCSIVTDGSAQPDDPHRSSVLRPLDGRENGRFRGTTVPDEQPGRRTRPAGTGPDHEGHSPGCPMLKRPGFVVPGARHRHPHRCQPMRRRYQRPESCGLRDRRPCQEGQVDRRLIGDLQPDLRPHPAAFVRPQ